MKKFTKLEAVLWSVALPGFSQLLAGKYIKGILFVLLEFLINLNSNFNLAIMYSFHWNIEKASEVTDFQWLLFYPCLYMFAMWDAYKEAMPENEQFSFLPFAFSAYFVTVGLIYSQKMKLFGILFGPVFMPMMFLIPGMTVGFFLKYMLLKYYRA